MDEDLTRLHAYLEELKTRLRPLSATERDEALREIESHLTAGIEAGTPARIQFARLGTPEVVARAYLAEHYNSASFGGRGSWRSRVLAAAFVAGTSLTSMFVVPILAVVMATFVAVSAVGPILGAMRMFGATWIQMDVGPGHPVPVEWSFVFGLAVGLACLVVAYGAYRLMRLYMRVVVAGYRLTLGRAA